MKQLAYALLNERYFLYKLGAGAAFKVANSISAYQKEESVFWMKTKTDYTLLISAKIDYEYLQCDEGWRGFYINQPLDFSATGICHQVTTWLKEGNISVIVIGSFDTDYFFVKESDFKKVIDYIGSYAQDQAHSATP